MLILQHPFLWGCGIQESGFIFSYVCIFASQGVIDCDSMLLSEICGHLAVKILFAAGMDQMGGSNLGLLFAAEFTCQRNGFLNCRRGKWKEEIVG